MNDKRKPNDPRPNIVTDDMLIYLDDLREDGCVNMFGARPFVAEAFKLDKKDSAEVLSYWMRTFAERHGLPT